jgi:hypothetical protein
MQFTLLTDGISDRALIPALSWLLRECGVNSPLSSQWADFRHLKRRPGSLAERVEKAVELYPCDLLFIHRDAETEPMETRLEEIGEALNSLIDEGWTVVPHAEVVPVRMQEAWLLISEQAIRTAANNPNGTIHLDIPAIASLEGLVDPKESLFALLREASELNARRRKKFSVFAARQRVAEVIEDWSALRALPAFAALEERLRTVVDGRIW